MKKSTAALYGVALVAIIGAASILYSHKSPKSTVQVSSAAPTPTPISTPEPTPSPIGATYTNSAIGLSFQYPKGYYVIEVPSYNRLQIQNVNYRLSGVPDATYREIDLSYGSYIDDENAIKTQVGVSEQDITAQGSTIRFYTYPNPNNSAYTIGEAFWMGKVPFSLSILWDRTVSSPAQGSQQADELSVMKEILPTITITQ